MNARQAFLREFRNHPEFVALQKECEERRDRPIRWKPNRSDAEWAHASGFCEGIDFVLNRLRYDSE